MPPSILLGGIKHATNVIRFAEHHALGNVLQKHKRCFLICLIQLLETHTVVFMEESTKPRLIAWFTVLFFFSPSKPQVKINSPLMYNFAKYGFEY